MHFTSKPCLNTEKNLGEAKFRITLIGMRGNSFISSVNIKLETQTKI